MSELYSLADIEMMRNAELSRIIGKSRVEELKNYAKNAGIRKIGIAYCIGLKKEAEKLKEILEKDFEVVAIDCKTGKIPSSELLGNDSKGISCNPAGQAKILGENKTELNISFGLCMGHDIVFNLKTQSPVTTLIVKDREFGHNPMKKFEEMDKQNK